MQTAKIIDISGDGENVSIEIETDRSSNGKEQFEIIAFLFRCSYR